MHVGDRRLEGRAQVAPVGLAERAAHEERRSAQGALDLARAQLTQLSAEAGPDELRAEVERTKRFEQGVQARDKVLEVLLEQLDIPVPESIVTEEVTNHLEGENRLDDDEHRAEVTESTRQQVATQLLLDEIVEKHEIQVGQDELMQAMRTEASRYPGQEKQVFEFFQKNPQALENLRAPIFEEKVVDFMLELAKVTDTTVSAADLQAA